MKNMRSLSCMIAVAALAVVAAIAVSVSVPASTIQPADVFSLAPALLLASTGAAVPLPDAGGDAEARYKSAGDAAFAAAIEAGKNSEEAGREARIASGRAGNPDYAALVAEVDGAPAAEGSPPPPAAAADVDAAAKKDAKAPPAASPAPKPPRLVKARVLADGPYGKINTVVSVPASVAKDDPQLDPHPEAVAYAENLAAIFPDVLKA